MSYEFQESVVQVAIHLQCFEVLGSAEIRDLYKIVMYENESFDGEDVSIQHMLKLMELRYQRFGLTPPED